jgi:hypothetical protein
LEERKLTTLDDWAKMLKVQAESSKQWAITHPMESGFIIVTLFTIGTFAASKMYDAWLKS